MKRRQLLRLRALSAESGLSISELVRDGVGNVLNGMEPGARTSRTRRAIAAAGRFRSGLSDIARRHDEFLVAAYKESKEQ